MAYDEELADRIRGLLPDVPVTEQKMFGGLAFLVGGNMAVAASGKGGLMLRCDPADSERLVGEPGTSRMEMRGKEMDGWLRVTSDAVADDQALAVRGVAAEHQAALAARGDRHVAADEEREAAEHPLLGHRRVRQQPPDPLGELLVVGHAAIMAPAGDSRVRRAAGCSL